MKVSSMFTSGADQFRNNLDAVMELERRALATVGDVEVLTARLDMMLGSVLVKLKPEPHTR